MYISIYKDPLFNTTHGAFDFGDPQSTHPFDGPRGSCTTSTKVAHYLRPTTMTEVKLAFFYIFLFMSTAHSRKLQLS